MKKYDEDELELSNCCNAELLDDTDLCSHCEEHCETNAEHEENIIFDIADAKHEQARDER